MSTKGIYTALSGSLAQSLKMDTIANNIANANTAGFKRDQQVFNEYLNSFEKEQEVNTVPRNLASIESFYHMNGGDQAAVNAKGTFTDFSQGSLKNTGNPLDLAIEGKGFFEVLTPQGVRLTRAGNFTLNGTGQLVTKDGYPVLKAPQAGAEAGANAADAASRILQITGREVHISDTGEVIEGTDNLGQLSVVNALNPDSLQKIGNNNYGFKDNMAPQLVQVTTPAIRSGFVEGSNVNIVQEMTDMITTQRAFESTQKAIHAYDSMADKLVNVVGKTTP